MSQKPDVPKFETGPVTVQDAQFLADIHLRAFPGFFLSALGERFLKTLYDSYCDDPTAITVVARRQDGTPVGAAVGTTQPSGFFSSLIKRRGVVFAAAAAPAVIRDPRKVPRLLRALTYRGDAPATGPGWALLSSVCVEPSIQGAGLGSSLIKLWLDEAAVRGSRTAYLTTDAVANDFVNSFYARLGWTLDSCFATHEGRLMNRYVRPTDVSGAALDASGR